MVDWHRKLAFKPRASQGRIGAGDSEHQRPSIINCPIADLITRGVRLTFSSFFNGIQLTPEPVLIRMVEFISWQFNKLV